MVTQELLNHKHINFYGCSFTDGGGLDNPIYLKNILDKDWFPNKWKQEWDGINCFYKFKDYYRFSNIIQRQLNCEISNFSRTANNNEHIFNKVFENINNKDTIHIVQWSYTERQLYWNDKLKSFFRIQGVEEYANVFDLEDNFNEDNPNYEKMIEHYMEFLTKYYNVEYESKKLNSLTELLTSYSKLNNIQLYFLPWERQLKSLTNFILESTLEWSIKNKMRISDETNKGYDDGHLSFKGNHEVANTILERFKKDNLLK